MQTFLHSRDRSPKGAALIIVLAFVVLLTGLTLAYFSRATTDRQLARSNVNDIKADLFASSALDIVVSDLRQEVANGSMATTVNGITIYSPTTAANMLPQQSGNPAGVVNLIRRSVRSDPIPAPGVKSRASAVNSTTDVSTNGRSVAPARWNSHYLVPKKNTATDDSIPIDAFANATPDWVFVTSQGPTPSPSAANVIGRYAYSIYDEGGLIDVNVKGYPSPTPSSPAYAQTIGRKGSGVFADLSQLANMSNTGINNLIGWRNYASAKPLGNLTSNFTFDTTSATNFVNYVLGNSNGFLSTSGQTWTGGAGIGTDQAFVTRQELINFRVATTGGIFTANALQFLGTFSRELNRPSWKPSTPAGSTIDYAGLAENPTAINRDLATARAADGQPLVKTRFSLTRINELTDPANATIQSHFGLKWNAGQNRWDYVGATGSTVQSTIERLDQVAGESREPNFFEMLKAVILNGSVGLGSGTPTTNTFVISEPKYYSTTNNLSADYQIMQIGANIIDAWDGDNIPTFVYFANNELAGVENLPYLSKVALAFRISNHGHGDVFSSWLIPSFWNPHQNASAAGGDVRFGLTSGKINSAISNPFPQYYYPPSPVTGTASDPYIQVRANAFAVPGPPIPSPAPQGYNANETGKSGGTNISLVEGKPYDGLFFGTIDDAFGGGNDWKHVDRVGPVFMTDVSGNLPCFQMQILVNGQWKPYQQWKSAEQSSVPIEYCSGLHPASKWKSPPANTFEDPEYVSLDPRTVRFGVWGSDANGTGQDYDYENGLEDTLDENGGGNNGVLELVTRLNPQPSTSFPSSSGTNYYLYSSNATANEQYADLDGVKRRGDWTTDPNGTAPGKTIMYAAATPSPTPPNSQDRPRILNAPFQSIAELGQVFRDQPWKTLNFATANSGDIGLVDAFTLQDAQVPMMAGRTSLNTKQASVLKAILSQAALKLDGTSILSPTQVTSLATDIANITNSTPLTSKADLLAQLATKPSFTGLGNKEARECVIRAFSDACQTRTWNLLIDMIAQSGRYAPGETDLRKFVVEGEKRYWLHVALDRFTGQVIDKQLETVNE